MLETAYFEVLSVETHNGRLSSRWLIGSSLLAAPLLAKINDTPSAPRLVYPSTTLATRDRIKLPSLPVLSDAFVTLGIWALLEMRLQVRRFVGSATASAFALLAIIPAIYLFGAPARDRIRFASWSLTYPSNSKKGSQRIWCFSTGTPGATRAARTISIWCPMSTTDFSAAIAPHRSQMLPQSQFTVADRWRRSHRLGCDIVWVRRVARGFYVIETYECAL